MAAAVHKDTDSYARPGPREIARLCGFDWAPRPLWLIEAEALNKTLYKAKKHIDKTQHLTLLGNDELKLQETATYAKWVKKLSHPVLCREAVWGVQTIHDASWTASGEFYWKVEVHCFPRAIAEDPLITDDHRDGMYNYPLDIVLTNGLYQLVTSAYCGPGEVDVDEGDEFLHGTVVDVSGGANEVLDDHDVAKGLAAIFLDGQFDQQFQALVNETKAIQSKALKRRLSQR
ncbi:hypothetical protein ACTJLC_21885 [Paraburkholderia sp. 22099]|uniref:hypothetical protein n=1 Tax=Paraburkholderia TaxID=1822464 RepID=UPI00285889A0|nr:hypothetical protein [Paraburkholderia terricola]MDR6450295.1 hypothetical protein [Paraburkholderia terricola]